MTQQQYPHPAPVDELAMLVRRLVQSLRKAAPDNDLADQALDYLKRYGFGGTFLRDVPGDVPAGVKPSKASEAVGTSPSANAPENVPALLAALQDAKAAINSMKAEAETAAQGDEQMMLEACEQISNEALAASLAIDAVLGTWEVPEIFEPAHAPTATPVAIEGPNDGYEVIHQGTGKVHRTVPAGAPLVLDSWEERECEVRVIRPSKGGGGTGVPVSREDFAWLVVQEACETEPADDDDPECIRILRRDLKTAVLAAFLRGDTTPAADAQDATQLATQAEARDTADAQHWRIDTSAGRPILVYKDCSVIEDEQARYVLGLIAAHSAGAADALDAARYRLLTPADVIEAEDEFCQDDCSWKKDEGRIWVGANWTPLLRPVRRAVAALPREATTP